MIQNLTSKYSSILCVSLICLSGFTTACEVKSNEVEGRQESKATADLTGQWKTEMLRFETDQCALKLDLANSGADFAVNDFTIACIGGGTEGLYSPLGFKVVPRSQFRSEQLTAVGGPAASQILALNQIGDTLEPRGWIDLSDPTNQKFSFAMHRWDLPLYNQLKMNGHLKADGSFEVDGISMLDGWAIENGIQFKKSAVVAADFVFGKSAWSKMRLPSTAKLSTSRVDQNYIYCVDRKFPLQQAIVDLKGDLYTVTGGTIGELGFIDRDGDNRVYMFRTDSGAKSESKYATEFGLSTTGVGGKTSGFRIVYTNDGYGYLSTANEYSRYLCRVLQNDVFLGMIGWNPQR